MSSTSRPTAARDGRFPAPASAWMRPWGLVRHYWVPFKLLITIVATAVLLLYTQTLAELAAVAASQSPASDDLSGLRSASPVLHAAAAVVLPLAATALAIHEPRGLTRRGWRAQQLRA